MTDHGESFVRRPLEAEVLELVPKPGDACKVLIAVFLSREFKHDETNRAWWSGRWYGRGLGTHAMSQPAREFVVKIIELSLWSSDLIIGHILLFMLTPPTLIPYFDRFHATILCKFVSLIESSCR